MNSRPGQPLRFPGYTQQPLQARDNRPPNLPSSGRLQNTTKLGNGTGTGWNFPAATNGIAAIANGQATRQNAGATSFAQTIGGGGGGHSSGSLDMSEFPSLGNNSQAFQNNNPIWQGQTRQTPVQRPQGQQQQAINTQPPPHPASPSNDDMFTGSSHLQGSLDDYRQPRQASGQDEFPALGRNGGTDEHNPDQQQQARGFNFPSQSSFPQQDASSTSRSAALNLAESTRSSSGVDRTMSPPQTSNVHSSQQPSSTNPNNISSIISNFSNTRASSGTQQPPNNMSEEYSNHQNGASKPDPEMSDSDRWGLGGFLAKIRSSDEMTQNLARGHDLTLLGLDLNSRDPIWPTWNGPFADSANSRPLMPDFTLPDCYTVTNVHNVRQKLANFSDETLFYIFYTQPRDMIQELAFNELNGRNWRYLKPLQLWLTKDPNLPEPIRITEEAEKGSYIFFDYRIWEKRRYQDFELHYRELAPSTGGASRNGVAAA